MLLPSILKGKKDETPKYSQTYCQNALKMLERRGIVQMYEGSF